uniref:Uncharacterized protein n=1 Tax=Timema poppense TaxID=170557 RepID=A0A7R9GWL6_TIMPO|nr:unnamed protein product [Timema poppensis]
MEADTVPPVVSYSVQAMYSLGWLDVMAEIVHSNGKASFPDCLGIEGLRPSISDQEAHAIWRFFKFTEVLRGGVKFNIIGRGQSGETIKMCWRYTGCRARGGSHKDDTKNSTKGNGRSFLRIYCSPVMICANKSAPKRIYMGAGVSNVGSARTKEAIFLFMSGTSAFDLEQLSTLFRDESTLSSRIQYSTNNKGDTISC